MTGPVTTEAFAEARELVRQSLKGGAPGLTEATREAVVGSIMLKITNKVLAPLLAAHQQVTAERDEARAEVERLRAVLDFEKRAHRVVTSELARLRAEGEAKDRALKDLEEASRPFAACVFNDNGDVTLSTGGLDVHDWLRLDRAQRTALARAATAREGA